MSAVPPGEEKPGVRALSSPAAWGAGENLGLSPLERRALHGPRLPSGPALPVPLSVHPALSCLQLRTDSEKRSLAESGLSWFSESEEKAPRKLEYDSGSLKMETAGSKWRRERPESCDDASKAGELKKPAGLGPPGPLKKGKTPPVAVTSPITHTAQSALKVAGEPRGQVPGPRGLLPWRLLVLSTGNSLGGRRRPACLQLPHITWQGSRPS